MRKKIIISSSAAAILVLAAVLAWCKFTETPEYRIMTGDSFEKRQVIKFLHKVEPWRSRRMLKKLVNDPDPQVRVLAVGCVGRNGYKELYPLIEAAVKEDEDPLVRSQAILACAMAKTENIIPLVSECQGETIPEIRIACLHTAEFGIHLAPDNVTSALADPDARIRDAALEAAVCLKTLEAVPILADNLQKEELFTMQQNLNALQQITGINKGLDVQAWMQWYREYSPRPENQ